MNSKTISKFICIALLAIGISVQTTECHACELLREIQYEQSKLLKVLQSEVMQSVFKNYNSLNVAVKDTIDTLWNNDAGNLLLRRLHNVIKNDAQRVTILWDTCDEKDESNYFRYRDSALLLDKNKFGDYVVYCNGKIRALPERLDIVMFHELCHALHDLEEIKNYNEQIFIPKFYNQSVERADIKETCDAWGNDEEIYTITGWYIASTGILQFDCLNTNSYMILDALKDKIEPEKIVQRIFYCDYWGLVPKFPNAKLKLIDELVIPLEKYIDAKKISCDTEEWIDMR